MNDSKIISEFREELITLGNLSHFCAHLGEDAPAEEKIERFDSEVIRKGMEDLQTSTIPEI